MCGICGIVSRDGAPVEAAALGRMATALAHRGPDDHGLHVAGGAGLGHRRLAIIDLTPDGHQPMANEDGTVHVVFNGEIYNFLELRPHLEKRGHRFRSRSDTEVILHLYEEHGTDCLRHLRGMFAFAIWDAPRRRLFAARDRLGKKPLYYARTPGGLLFASEIKGVLAEGSVPRRPHAEALHHYLTYQCVPSPLTAFEGIERLPPAHFLIYEGGGLRVERYWRLAYGPKLRAPDAELAAELRERLREAVRLRLVSDVPLGAFLSGGVDSSAVVALMSEAGGGPVRTFSIGFTEEEFDELPYARQVAERFGTRHTEWVVEPRALEILPRLVWHFDEPFADPSAIPTWHVSRLAREQVTVALNGDGGDEAFAGYGRYLANDRTWRLEQSAPRRAYRRARALAGAIRRAARRRTLPRGLRRALGRVSPEMENALRLCHFSPEEKEALYSPAFAAAVGGIDSFALLFAAAAASGAADFLDRTLAADVALYLPDDLLVKVDVASMAHALEARSPFLDHELMEFAARLPVDLKIRGGVGKYLLKRALADILPEPVLRRRKMGFGVPLARWFRGELREFVSDTLLGGRALARGYFRPAAVRALVEEHLRGREDRSNHLWDLTMLELWHRTFIDPPRLDPPP
jgi:asparagine synthase (glutamine-hydrolysing)